MSTVVPPAAPPVAPPIVEAVGLHTYYGASHVLHGVDLTVGVGESVALLGRNGMGKTTTIRSIFGLTAPRRGTVRIKGHDMTGASPHRVARQGLALVPEGRGIFPNLSVEENMVMAARPGSGDGEEWTIGRIVDIFPILGERISHMGNQLSGGEQQMLSIARALLTNPEMLILDEATEGLAPLIRKEIWAVIRRIKEAGIATLVVDKDLGMLLEVCDRCVIVAKGRVVYDGASADLAANPDIHLRHLGV